MNDDKAVRRDEPGRDEAYKPGKDTEADTEGHKRFLRDAGPDEGIKRGGGVKDDEPDAPGPDESKFSDRSLKVGIVPVEW